MNWGGNCYRRDLELDGFIRSIDPEELSKWGRTKSRDFLYNIGYNNVDKLKAAERNEKFVGNIILVRGHNEVL